MCPADFLAGLVEAEQYVSYEHGQPRVVGEEFLQRAGRHDLDRNDGIRCGGGDSVWMGEWGGRG